MQFLWIVNMIFHTLHKINRFQLRNYLVVLTKDELHSNDNNDKNKKFKNEVFLHRNKTEFVMKRKQKNIYDGCDQRFPTNISDKDSLLFYYSQFYEMFQKHDLLKKLQSESISEHEKLKIMDECNHLLDMKPKQHPLYKGFEEFL